MRRVAIVVGAVALVVVWGVGTSLTWHRTPWGRGGSGCRPVHLPPASRILSAAPQTAGVYSSGKPTSAAEAEDQLLRSPSLPLETRLDPAVVARIASLVPADAYRLRLPSVRAVIALPPKCD